MLCKTEIEHEHLLRTGCWLACRLPSSQTDARHAYRDISTYAKIEQLLFLHILIYLDSIM